MKQDKTISKPKAERLARPAEVLKLYPFSEPTLWRWVRERKGFPQPRKLGPNVTVFSLDELEAFFCDKPAPHAGKP